MKEQNPMVCVIFGATGDLAQNKIIPALMDLYSKDLLPTNFYIIGFSRKDLHNEDYRIFAENALERQGHNHDKDQIARFLSLIQYKRGDINTISDYENLNKYLLDLDNKDGVCSNKIFYLAVPPQLYAPVFQNIYDSGLMKDCAEGSWRRILVEKPFGSNAIEARKLDKMLGSLFREEQIFRIDHYLAKEAIQNILTFRFANAIFEPIWNKDHIEKVNIKLFEKEDSSQRVNFYDGIGALRDVGQNHLLQMMALIAMEDPKSMKVELIRKSRFEVLAKIMPFSKKINEYAYRAQYKDYKKTEGVNPKTDTETYFKLKLQIKNDRWKGVPFYLESGKALDENLVEIMVTFKDKESSVCVSSDRCEYNNVLKINIQPKQEISICFWTKKPGLTFDLENKDLSFKYNTNGKLSDAYEKVLYDAIKGDQTLFISTAETATEWSIISEILDKWKNLPLVVYDKGINPEELTAIK